ncbi:hypothetical protein HanPI659440_Chr08g0313641 [Helianthus annuus]|nr:hypothetical protein HanPI659440_Chr08g0313641 [Helianthus annuus]
MTCQKRQAEKNELCEEELVLKAKKAKLKQQVKSMTPHDPAACQAEGTKVPVGFCFIITLYFCHYAF